MFASGRATGAARSETLRSFLRGMAFVDEPYRQAVALLEFGRERPRGAAVVLFAVIEHQRQPDQQSIGMPLAQQRAETLPVGTVLAIDENVDSRARCS